jgi:hypothetical protein
MMMGIGIGILRYSLLQTNNIKNVVSGPEYGGWSKFHHILPGWFIVQSTSTSHRTLLLTHCITRGQYWGSGSASWSVDSVCFWACRIRLPQVRIRLRIRLRILPSSSKNSIKALISSVLWLLLPVPGSASGSGSVGSLCFPGFPDPRPDPLVRGTDPRIRIHIRIRTKMSWIPNTARRYVNAFNLYRLFKYIFLIVWFTILDKKGCVFCCVHTLTQINIVDPLFILAIVRMRVLWQDILLVCFCKHNSRYCQQIFNIRPSAPMHIPYIIVYCILRKAYISVFAEQGLKIA